MDRYTSQGYNEPDNNRSNFNQQSKEDIKQTARQAGDKIKNESRNKTESAKSNAADQLDEYTQVTESIAQTLHDEHHETLSTYVGEIAGYVSNISSGLREKSADDLMRDAKSMARKNPALFIAGSVAIGLGIARLARTGVESSSERHVGAESDSSAPRIEDEGFPEEAPYVSDSKRSLNPGSTDRSSVTGTAGATTSDTPTNTSDNAGSSTDRAGSPTFTKEPV